MRCWWVHFARSGTCRRGRGRSTPSGTGIRSPYAWAVPGWKETHPAARNVPRRRRRRGRLRSPRKRAIRASPAGPQCGTAGSPAGGRGMRAVPIPIKDPCDKPDLSLVHLTGVQGSGILCGNRSTSYSGRRISDRSGRPSVAVHQSNRQGRSRAPSSGQVRDDVSRGDQGASGR